MPCRNIRLLGHFCYDSGKAKRLEAGGIGQSLFQQREQLLGDVLQVKRSNVDSAFGNNRQVKTWADELLILAEKFPDESLDPIAFYCVAGLFPHPSTEPGWGLAIRTSGNEDDKALGKVTASGVVADQKFRSLLEPALPGVS